MAQTSNPHLVIFDCDGVLVDSEVVALKIDEFILADLGWPIGREEIITRFVGRSEAHFVHSIEEHLGRKLVSDWEDSYLHLYREAYIRELQPVDGIIEALGEIKLPTCVASSGSHEKMEFTLGLTGLWHRFTGRIFSASEVEHGKPAPDLFLHAASVLGHEARQCVVVEDSAPGVQAALAAGMKVIGYAGGVTARERLEGTDVHLIDHMSELPHAVSALLNQ